jgi:hypothetical protein
VIDKDLDFVACSTSVNLQQLMAKAHPFYLIKRPSKRGKAYPVVYGLDTGYPKSTGVLVDPQAKSKRHEPAGMTMQ